MNTEMNQPEVLAKETSTELSAALADLAPQSASGIEGAFTKHYQAMKTALEARLRLQKIRTAADKTREELKKESIRYGGAVQSVYKLIEYPLVSEEKRLKDQEEVAERLAQEARQKVADARSVEIVGLEQYMPVGFIIATAPEQEFRDAIEMAKAARQTSLALQKKRDDDLQAARDEKKRLDDEIKTANDEKDRLAKEIETNRKTAEATAPKPMTSITSVASMLATYGTKLNEVLVMTTKGQEWAQKRGDQGLSNFFPAQHALLSAASEMHKVQSK